MNISTPTILELPAVGTYRMDPQRSNIAYSGRHMFGVGKVHATFALGSGELRVAEPFTASTVSVTVAAASFTSSSAKRDKDVRAAGLLDVLTYPDISFAADGLDNQGDRWQLSGTVTAHGTTVPIRVIVDRISAELDGVRVHARASHLDRYAFGINKGKGMVGRYLDLDLDVVAVPA